MPVPPSPAEPTDRSPDLRVHVADLLIAKIAAHHAREVPGVADLHRGLADTVTGLAARMGPDRSGKDDDEPEISTDGITVTDIDDTTVHVTVEVTVFLGRPCLEVAQTVQQRLDAEIAAATGLRSVVTVNLVEVEDEDEDDRT
jgi:uncharacterized alkaline shock family protein YloU